MGKTIVAVVGIIAGASVLGGAVAAVSNLNEKKLAIAKEEEQHRHDESMPDSYWEAKKAEAEASIEIKKLDNEKEIELKKLDNEKQIKLQADKLEAEKNMPEGYFKTKEADINKKKEEALAKIQAESAEKIEKEKAEVEIKLAKERNKSNETLAREARSAISMIKSFT